MYKLTTESGRVYLIDTVPGRWSRSSGDGSIRKPSASIRQMKAGTGLSFPWQEIEGHTWEDRMPVVGEHLFISAQDYWYTSTKISSIEDLPDED